MTPICIFASGRGGNFDAIQKSIESSQLNAKIVALVCDKPNAPVIGKAKKASVPTIVVPVQDLTREDHEKEILRQLKPYQPRFLVFCGYMRLLTELLIEEFRSKKGYTRMVNIHPSLLPAFPGKNAYAQAFDYGVKITGVTVHLVEKEMDSGPICAQEAFDISNYKTTEEVQKKGVEIEHRLYSKTLTWVLEENFEITRGRVCVRKN